MRGAILAASLRVVAGRNHFVEEKRTKLFTLHHAPRNGHTFKKSWPAAFVVFTVNK